MGYSSNITSTGQFTKQSPWICVALGFGGEESMLNKADFLHWLICSLSSRFWSLWLLSCRERNNYPCLVNLAEMLLISHRIMAMRLCEIHGELCRHSLKKPTLTSRIADREYKSVENGQQRDLNGPCYSTSYWLVELTCH